MLPLIQANEIKLAVVDYLRSTFSFEDTQLDQAFQDALLSHRRGMFKGPYMQVRLPFDKVESVEDKATLEKALYVKPPFEPYIHQYKSFIKLSTRDNHTPEPVILTTGTGSGKTESFLFPLLDYCYQNRTKQGVKAIILYPMNALATDQARRIAEEIHGFKDKDGSYPLRGVLRAGLFIGEGKDKTGVRNTRMGEDHIIEDRDTLIKTPPDILLTNFKMLDFALLQARFHSLWQHNLKNTELLKFIVLDELHTYDGAKGSDVANLIRRLKLKLKLPKNHIVPVGTSATMAGGADGKQDLVDFFSNVFGVDVTTDAVIEEQRQEPDEFFADNLVIPNVNTADVSPCVFLETDTYDSYIARQQEFWGYAGLDRGALGTELKRNDWLYELLKITESKVKEIEVVVNRWNENIEQNLPKEKATLLFGSLLSLMAYAKEVSGTKSFPFLFLQITYWLRSLNKVVRKLQPRPLLEWESDIDATTKVKSLPPYFCRECGGSGWIGIKKEGNTHFEDDLKKTRQQFIANNGNKNLYFINSLEDKPSQDIYASDYTPTGDTIDGYMHPEALSIYDNKESAAYFKILGTRITDGNKIDKICPHCTARNTLALIGTGVPTLESIASAQILATATDPTEDQNRKLLAFTNGVQDAAHQAGFIENRNFRFSMRHAIQAIIKASDVPLTMPQVYEKFTAYWKEESKGPKGDLQAYYYKFLPPDSESRIDIDDYKNRTGKLSAAFDQEFSNRMTWEIWSEFSYRAAIGRTLEKTGASATYFEKETLEEVYDQMKFWLDQNELGERIAKDKFLQFTNGFLHRLRTKGGVDHKYLKKYRTEKTNYYLIGSRGNVNKGYFLMRNFGKSSRLPKFVTLASGPNTQAFDIVQAGTKANWFTSYFHKSFELVDTSEKELINDFYAQLLDYLDANRVLDKRVAAGVTNYGLSENSILITKEVSMYSCKTCGHQLSTGKKGDELVDGMKCLQYRCGGSYAIDNTNQLDYYRMVYNRGRSLRIFSRDHTGLIDRNEREKLEFDFKKQPYHNSTNVLVATSTLEMGIDIGDLNVTFNSSLPPETANYLQRVGRAGRSSGTSMILNLAGRGEHDLYYFQDPDEMMSGEVRTPACYLEAKDILKRHFMAFCFDSWATLNPEANKIPAMVRVLRLMSLPVGDPSFVFQQIASFIESNKTELFTAFKSQYLDQLGEDSSSLQSIFEELSDSRFVNRLTRIHKDLVSELSYYTKKRKDLKTRLKGLPSTGQETTILKNEERALSGAIRTINHRNVLEHLTNIGLLPNYAFPETGVLLNAQIKRKKEVDGKTEYVYEDFNEIVRPSSSALSELAPANMFYSQGHKLKSEGLEIKSQDEYEVHRFCSNCNFVLKDIDISPKDQMQCPVCGHGSWSSLGNKKTLVKLQSVISVNDKENSKITDSSDDRDQKYYQKSVHISIDQTSSKGAHILKRVPFGIEFFQTVEYMEVNTGIREEGFFGTREIEINNKKHPQVGFVVCNTCGKSTERTLTDKEISSRNRSYHFPYCSNKEELYLGEESEVFKEIYLYRKFNTEALTILLPVQEFRSEERVALFKAGLQLGLKLHFKGRPDHILIKEMESFNKATNRKDRYLVFYETIPGGTGYLSKIFDTKIFTEILEKAYESIRYCNCKDEGKSGCYKCIYTYGNQFERAELHRSEAEELFAEILEKTDEWNSVESLKNASTFANNEESDLEWKFVTLLEQIADRHTGSTFKKENEKGLKIYRLSLSYGTSDLVYKIYPQNLGRTLNGVSLKTRPDFVINCVHITTDGKAWTLEQLQEIKPITIYLDGYEFHASKNHPRFLSDLAIRNSIINSSRYFQWTFTWDDFKDNVFNDLDDVGNKQDLANIDARFFKKHASLKDYRIEDVFYQNNITRFFHVLINPTNTIDLKNWSSLALFNCQAKTMGSCFTDDELAKVLSDKSTGGSKTSAAAVSSFAFVDGLPVNTEAFQNVFIRPSDFVAKGFTSVKELESWEKEGWIGFWRTYNLTQFHQINRERDIDNDTQISDDTLDLSLDIKNNFDPSLYEIVQKLIDKKIEFNTDLDFDLMDGDIILASAELGSHSHKFVVNPFSTEDTETFESEGYTIFTPQNFKLDT
jgi:DEAD/DEAH box helicase domain-containing protein